MLDLLLVLSPVILGSIIAMVNNEKVTSIDNKFENWLSTKKNSLVEKKGKFSRFFSKPLVSSLLQIASWTKNIQHNGLKSGVRLASYLYIVVVAAFILFMFAYIIVGIIIFLLLFWLGLSLLGSSGGSSPVGRVKYFMKGNKKYDSETGERIITQDGKTYREGWTGKWQPDTDWTGKPEVETDAFGNPKIETNWMGKQKIETEWTGKPIIPPDKKDDK